MEELEKITDKEFFRQGPVAVAKQLVGRDIVRYFNGTEVRGTIREVSAWQGTISEEQKFDDYEPGTISVSERRGSYLLDITVGAYGNGCVTIVDAVFEFDGKPVRVKSAGNLCKALQIEPCMTGDAITDNKYLSIEGESVPVSQIQKRDKSKVPTNCKGFFYKK